MGNDCYRSIPNIVPAFLQTKELQVKMYRSIIECAVLFSRAVRVQSTGGGCGRGCREKR